MSQSVGCALIWNQQDQILIARRRLKDSYGGYWEFPGGKKESGETLEQCAAREVQEELGISIKVGALFYQMTVDSPLGKQFELSFYWSWYVSGKAQALKVEEYAWVDPVQLKQYQFIPANDELIEKIQSNRQ